jgi:hypothetical protein
VQLRAIVGSLSENRTRRSLGWLLLLLVLTGLAGCTTPKNRSYRALDVYLNAPNSEQKAGVLLQSDQCRQDKRRREKERQAQATACLDELFNITRSEHFYADVIVHPDGQNLTMYLGGGEVATPLKWKRIPNYDRFGIAVKTGETHIDCGGGMCRVLDNRGREWSITFGPATEFN